MPDPRPACDKYIPSAPEDRPGPGQVFFMHKSNCSTCGRSYFDHVFKNVKFEIGSPKPYPQHYPRRNYFSFDTETDPAFLNCIVDDRKPYSVGEKVIIAKRRGPGHDFTDRYLPHFCCRCGEHDSEIFKGSTCLPQSLPRAEVIRRAEHYISSATSRAARVAERMPKAPPPPAPECNNPASPLFWGNPSPIQPQMWQLVGGLLPQRKLR